MEGDAMLEEEAELSIERWDKEVGAEDQEE